jgi:LCP family protein required for cell wall assembly
MKRWTLCIACGLLAFMVALAGCSTLLPQAASPTAEPAAPPITVRVETPTVPAPPVEETAAPSIPAETIEPLPIIVEDRVLNILLLGSDQRQGESGPWRTDVIMWVTIHRDTKQVGILSIPRDLWVSIPKVGENRINVADYYGETLKYPGGGPALVADTLKNNLGLETDRYIRLNFEAFEQVIDAMGGVTVQVDCPVEDNFIDPTYPGGLRPLRVSAGTQVMDGKTALMFARSRHGRGDIDRTRRQQRVLMGIRDRALDVEMIPRIPRIWVSLKKSVDTDLSLQEILSLALLAKDISADQIHSRVMDYTMLRDWTTPAGAMVLLPDRAKVKDAIEHLMDSPPLMESSRYPGTCP